MKFLHISDLHIGKRVNEFSMIEDQKYILRQIKKIALEQQVDAVMIAGDIYDKFHSKLHCPSVMVITP